jgi:hypothetical protein
MMKTKRILVNILFIMFIVSAFAQFSGGAGTEFDPWQIATADDLNNVRNFLGSATYFIQTADIDLGVPPWNAGYGWSPIGNEIGPFSGKYNGAYHTIAGLMIYRMGENNQGLFGNVESALIEKLGLTAVNVYAGSSVGSLVGTTGSNTIIENCFSTGSVSGFNHIGGLVGKNNSSEVRASYSDANASGNFYIGGLVGLSENNSTIINCYSRGNINYSDYAGNLIGENFNSSIINCYSTGLINYISGEYVNGLVGLSSGTITASFWDYDTTGLGFTNYGIAQTTEFMKNKSTYTGTGWNFDSIWTIAVSGIYNDGYPYFKWRWPEEVLFAGGSGTESNPYIVQTAEHLNNVRYYLGAHYEQTADIDLNIEPYNQGMGWAPIGAYQEFYGVYDGKGFTIDQLYIYGRTGRLGLFMHTNQGHIRNVRLTNVNINGTDNEIGALVGSSYNYSTIFNCSSQGMISGSNRVGGLVGINWGNSTIEESFSLGDVNGNGSVGGLVGYNHEDAIIENCYSRAGVSGTNEVGGLVGYNSWLSNINNCYSTGYINGYGDFLGGLVGRNYISAANSSFWDMQTSGRSTSEGGTGKTTAQMKDIQTYTNVATVGLDEPWDFVTFWGMQSYHNNSYPFLLWENPPVTYLLSISVVGDGYTSPGAGIHQYEENEMIMLHAYPISGFFFDYWDINGSIIETDSTQVTMTENITVTAYFIEAYEFKPATFLYSEHGNMQAKLNWSTPDDGGSISGKGYMDYLLGYQVYRFGYIISAGIIQATNYTDTNLTNGVWYEYSVKAIYKHGESVQSHFTPVYPNPTPWIKPGGPGSDVETSMDIFVSLYVNNILTDSDRYWVGAFSPDGMEDCRGLEQNKTAGYILTMLGAYSDYGRVFNFHVYDDLNDFIYPASESVIFISDGEEGIDIHITTILDEYTLNVTRNGSGNTTPPVGQHTYQAGTVLTLNAYPATGWKFDYWIINSVQYFNSEKTITMNIDVSAAAYFSRLPYELTISKVGEGTTLPDTGVHTYNYGDTVNLLATAASNYIFDKWVINGYNVYQRYVTFTISQNMTATAYFEPKPVSNITVDPNVYLVNTFPTVHEQFNISATIFPATAFNQNVIWTSNRPEIATVQQTNQLQTTVTIQPNAPRGVARIRVKTEDGGLRAFCFVIVVNTIVDDQNVPEVFTVANHPFLINSNINLNSRTTTTIEDSVMLFFAGDYELNVNRQLIAENVTFAGYANGDRNQWQGLRFNSNSGNSNINGSNILNAVQPLKLTDNNMVIDSLYVDGGDFENINNALEILGNSSPNLNRMDILNYKNGIKFHNGTQGRSTPVITNTRVRNSGESSRIGTNGLTVEGNVNAQINNCVVEGFESAILIENLTRDLSTPVITNTRVRNSGESSRQPSYGLKTAGFVSAEIVNCDFDDMQYGIYIVASPDTLLRNTPVITNTRVRNSADTSRQDESAIFLKNITGAQIDNCDVENYQTGIKIEAVSGFRSTPVITNTRVRNSSESSRIESKGILLDGSVNALIENSDIENFEFGLLMKNLERDISTPVITNTRVRNSTESSRLVSYGIQVEGAIAFHIDDCEIDDFQYGINFLGNHTQFRSTPVITNTRVRNSSESSRTESLGFVFENVSDFQMDNCETENLSKGIFIYNDTQFRSTPVITNTRVRNSGESSRETTQGFWLYGPTNVEIENCEIEDFTIGIYASNRSRDVSTPVITNTRVRNSGESSRVTTYAIQTVGSVAPEIKNCDFEDVMHGIFLQNSLRPLRSTPVITNTRVRNSGETSREDGTGIFMYNYSNIKVDSCIIENFSNGIHVYNSFGPDSTTVIKNNRISQNGNSFRSVSRGIIINGSNNGEIAYNEIANVDSAICVYGSMANPLIHENLVHYLLDYSGGINPIAVFARDCSNLQIRKNTIYGYPIGFHSTGAQAYLISNTIWNNVVNQEPIIQNGGNLTFIYNNIARPNGAIQPGQNNINQLPMFRSPNLGQYEYISGSPCIDGGYSELPNEPDGSRADIGKYYEPELVDFYALNPYGVSPHTVQFVSHSYGFRDVHVHWDFNNDGTFGAFGREVGYTYEQPGVYSVRVRVVKPNLLDSITKQKIIVIQENPLPQIQNLMIEIVDNNVNLTWDPINTGRFGKSKDPNLFYLIYISRFPDKQFAFLNYRTGDLTAYTHEGVLDEEDRAFYQIIGFEGTLRELERFINTQEKYTPLRKKNTVRRNSN